MKMISTGKFRAFDNGYIKYQLQKINKVPITFYIGDNDPFANKNDAKWTWD